MPTKTALWLPPVVTDRSADSVRYNFTSRGSFGTGGTARLDYLDAQRDYRATQVAYINLVGAYLSAASQLNTAVGREVIP